MPKELVHQNNENSSGAFVPEDVVVQLMEKVTNHQDRMAFRQLVGIYQDRLYATSYRVCGNKQDAEEVVQDTFVKLWTHGDTWIQEKGKLGTWLYTIAMNKCKDYLRKRKSIFSFLSDDIPSDDIIADQKTYQNEIRSQVKKSIDQLPLKQRQALVLSYYEGLTHQEIGRILNASAKSIESLIARARKKLLGELQFLKEEE